MIKSTEGLSQHIGEELTNQIELFLLNNIESSAQQIEIVGLINKAFYEGADKAFATINEEETKASGERKEAIAKNFKTFFDSFTDKLNGQDSELPK